MWNWTIFLIGAAGALAPEINRLYTIRSDPSQFKWSWFYLTVSLLFVALGGTIAVLLPAASAIGAFYAGIATPVLINAILRKSVPLPPEVPPIPPAPPDPNAPRFWSPTTREAASAVSLRSFLDAL